MQITNHTQLLNALIEKYNLKSYLEIGVQNPENNFDKVKCGHKIGVDPDTPARSITVKGGSEKIFKCTSDEYFNKKWPESLPRIDIGFIDGLHHKEQVKKDFENLIACLSDNGFIVIHDVLPENEAGTKVPRETKQWWGDVYKWAMSIASYPVNYITFNIDNGCMLVWKNKSRITPLSNHKFPESWESYKEIGKQLMNVTNTVEI